MEQIESRLRKLMAAEFPALSDLPADQYFVDQDDFDSLMFVALLERVAAEFAVVLADRDLAESNVGSIANLTAFLHRIGAPGDLP